MQDLLDVIYPLVTLAVSAFVLPWLKQKADAERSSARKADADCRVSLFQQARDVVRDTVSGLMESEYPKLAEQIVNGDMAGVEEVKDELYRIGREAEDAVMDTLDEMGFDPDDIGPKRINQMIRSVVDELSPFPGPGAAKAFANEDKAREILEKGTTAVRAKNRGA